MTLRNPIPEQTCPYCGRLVDASSTHDEGTEPRTNDVAICFDCQGIGIFDDKLIIRQPTLTQLSELKNSPLWSDIERARTHFHETN